MERTASTESFSILRRSGSSVMNSEALKTPGTLSRTNRHTASQPNIMSVKEMVAIMKGKEATWGIQGYKIPEPMSAREDVPKYTFPKESGKSYAETFTKHVSYVPSPVAYETAPTWTKSPLGFMKGSERNTFITRIFKRERNSPSPHSYSPDPVRRCPEGGKSIRDAKDCYFLRDAEYISSNIPTSANVTKTFVLPRVKSLKWAPPKQKKGDWKVRKEDGPDPCLYADKEVAYN